MSVCYPVANLSNRTAATRFGFGYLAIREQKVHVQFQAVTASADTTDSENLQPQSVHQDCSAADDVRVAS